VSTKVVLSGAALCAFGCNAEVTSVGQWDPEEVCYLEAEDGELSAEFQVRRDATASARAFLEPVDAPASEAAPGAARARYVFTLPNAGEFELWGRIRSPSVDTNRLWFQLDGGTWYKWRISVGDVWFWDDFHDDTDYGRALTFELDAGVHELTLANCVSGVALDRLRVSSVDEPAPVNDTECNPPHSIELGGECFPSCGSQSGDLCGEAACSGKTIFDAYDCDVCCREAP
jgi:hypothetical protein